MCPADMQIKDSIIDDPYATPEEMERNLALAAEFQRGWDLAKAESAAEASRADFDLWMEQGLLPERDAFWLAWQAGFEHGWTAKAKE